MLLMFYAIHDKSEQAGQEGGKGGKNRRKVGATGLKGKEQKVRHACVHTGCFLSPCL